MPNVAETRFVTNTHLQRGELIALSQVAALAKAEQNGDVLTIQVLRAGEFTDMYGKDFALSSADLDAYIANSNALLEQEQVPIEIGHPLDTAPAAAWYRNFFKRVIDGVEWVCAQVELTALGAESLAQKLYKYFSSVINIETQEIRGGGFVNRPAVSGQQPLGSLAAHIQYKESVMTTPLASAKNSVPPLFAQMVPRALAHIQLEMSQEEAQRALWDALRAKYSDPLDEYGNTPWVVATYADHVIVNKDDKQYRIDYAFEGDAVRLGEPVEVETVYAPKSDTDTATALAAPNIQNTPATALLSQTNFQQGGQTPMTQPVVVQSTTPIQTPPAQITEANNPAQVEQLIEQARTDARRAAEAQAQEMELKLAKARDEERERVMRELQRKETVNSLVVKLTSGRRQFPYRPNELADALLKLSDADFQIIAPLFEKIQETGLVELGERGTVGHGIAMLKHLSEDTRAALSHFVGSGGKVETFFKANPQLGKADEFDLSEFAK